MWIIKKEISIWDWSGPELIMTAPGADGWCDRNGCETQGEAEADDPQKGAVERRCSLSQKIVPYYNLCIGSCLKMA